MSRETHLDSMDPRVRLGSMWFNTFATNTCTKHNTTVLLHLLKKELLFCSLKKNRFKLTNQTLHFYKEMFPKDCSYTTAFTCSQFLHLSGASQSFIKKTLKGYKEHT